MHHVDALRRNESLEQENRRLKQELAAHNRRLHDRWLRDVLTLCYHESDQGFGGVDVFHARLSEVLSTERMEEIEELSWEEKQAIVPDLCALGFWVAQWDQEDDDCVLSITWYKQDDWVDGRSGSALNYPPTGGPPLIYLKDQARHLRPLSDDHPARLPHPFAATPSPR